MFTRTAAAKVLIVPPRDRDVGSSSHGNPHVAAGAGDGVTIQVNHDPVRTDDEPGAGAGQIVIQLQVLDDGRAAEIVGRHGRTGQYRQACQQDRERETRGGCAGVKARCLAHGGLSSCETCLGKVWRRDRRVMGESLEISWFSTARENA